MRYILCLLVFSVLIFTGCKKDKSTTAIPKLKREIRVVLPSPLEIDTADYTYNAKGDVIEITHTFGKGREVFTYSGSTVTLIYFNSLGTATNVSVYYLNSLGLADSLSYDSGNYTYSYKYNAGGFKTEEIEYSLGTLSTVNTYVNNNQNTTTWFRQFPGNPVITYTYFYDLQQSNTLDNANKGKSFLGKFSTNALIGFTANARTNSYDTEGRIVRTYWVSGTDLLSNYYEYY